MAEGSDKRKAKVFLKDFTQHGPPTSVFGFLPVAINSVKALWSEDRVSGRTRSFGQHEMYVMDKVPRGPVLIINVKVVCGTEPRIGTDLDRDALVSMFKGFEFGPITVYNDSDGLTAKDIIDKVDHFLGKVEPDAQACAMCFLSHGDDGLIAGTDKRDVEINDLQKMFCSCQNLYEKPKLLLFQACRGGKIELLPKLSVVKADYITSSNQCLNSDLIVCYPTAPGHVSYRHTTRGSIYIQTLVKVFQEKASTMNLQDMIVEVHNRLAEFPLPPEDKERIRRQTPGIYHSLRKHWYLTSTDSQNP